MCVLFVSARYLAHYSVWGVVSALSAEYDGLPFGTIQSFADGPLDNSTGVPYFYISPLSDTYKNIQRSASVSLTLTEASGEYCRSQGTCTVPSFSASCALCAPVCFVLLYMYSVFIEFHYIEDSKAWSVSI